MQAFLILVLVVATNAANPTAPTGSISIAQQRQFLDISFAIYDKAPKDGDVMESEWDATMYKDDLNNDTCISIQEYLKVHSCPVADMLYKQYDLNSDGCLDLADMYQEFHLIDYNKNGAVSLFEWEQYFLDFVRKIYPQYILGQQGR